jgi:flagellar hook-associated protein 2
MSRIQSSVGLITGIPIEETVNKLMAVAARPRDLVLERGKALDAERLALTELTSLVLALEFEANRLGAPSLFQTKSVTSSDPTLLEAKLTEGANPAPGNYKFRTLQTASAHQLASASFQSLAHLAEEGTFAIGFGGFVDQGISLDELNAGAGVRRGAIRITDRAGNVTEIDLRLARTVDDVLSAINNNGKADVAAVADGNSFRLIDTSGGTGNLKVQDIGTGKTALDLGLAGINVAASSAIGSAVQKLHATTRLTSLNDGTGVPLAAANDLAITLADATTLNVDLGNAETLGDVLDALNAAAPAKLSAAIAADGNRIELTDLSAGAGTFAVLSVGAGTAAEALGLTTTAVGGTITGSRILSGLRDTLLSSLRGGQGLGPLGEIEITNRANISSTVDLVGAETLADAVAIFNGQAIGVTASINTARNGIVLTDTTGASASNLIVADGDATDTATALGIAVVDDVTEINSGSLDRQQVGRATLLSSLNGGQGIDLADILITDSNGATGAADLNTTGSEAKTLGDVIDRINAITTAQVEARINDTGDGIVLIDQAGGTGTLLVKEVGKRTAAADLRLLGPTVTKEIDGVTTQVIDGTSRVTVDLSDLETGGTEIELSSLNGGKGVAKGAFRITDRTGRSAVVVLNASGGEFNTVADVIEEINSKGLGVQARINDKGNGILLYATAGSGTLKVEDLAGGTTAVDLKLAGEGSTAVVDEVSTQAIDGAGTFSQSTALNGLTALAAKINSFNAGFTANTIFDGAGYRLLLSVNETGAGRELLVDGAGVGLDFEQLSAAQNAIIEFGGTAPGTGLLVESPDNKFDEIIPGVELTVVAPSADNVTVQVAQDHAEVGGAVQDFVDAFNSVRAKLDETTAFNAEDLSTGILFGTTAALRVESDLNRILSGHFFGAGEFTSLEAIGLAFDAKGKLAFDQTRFNELVAQDPAAIEQFFTQKTSGLAAKLKTTLEQLAGEENSVLTSRTKTLADIIENTQDRVDFMNERLERERERLFTEFARLESSIAAMQGNLTALANFRPVPPLASASSSRSSS